MRGFVLGLLLALAAGPAAALTVTKSGPVEVVARWARDACAQRDTPDMPARAFRDRHGTVRLIASYSTARALTGPSLDEVSRDCRVIFQGGGRDDPARHDDRSWLSAVHTLDGATVYALVSNEFHGQKRPALCTGGYMACWRNSITAALSTDGGESFALMGPAHVVAALPYAYSGTAGRRTGYFAPSNIIAHDGHWYAFIWAERFGAQARGACLLRTDDLADPDAWRAWDGDSFSVPLQPAAQAKETPEPRTCAPVSPQSLSGTVRSLVLHRPSGRFLALLATVRNGTPGIWAVSSPDLLTWSEPQLVWGVPLLFKHGCDDAAYDYPSLLDPDSPGLNFETVDEDGYIYTTRLNLTGCKITWDRDLVRFPVRIE